MRIAILEDDPQQLHMMEQMVHSMGHTCVGYPTGAQLTKDLRRESFDLLILDWELPDTSGPEVAARSWAPICPSSSSPCAAKRPISSTACTAGPMTS